MRTPFPKYDADLVAAIEEHFQLDTMTEIIPEYQWNHIDATDGDFTFPEARGSAESTVQPYRAYSRPMFQVYRDGVNSGLRINHTPCPDCDDWSRTPKCSVHYDLPYDTKKQEWVKPGMAAPLPTAYAPPRHPDGQPITQVSFSLHRPGMTVDAHRSTATSNLSHLADSLRYLLEGAWNNAPQLVRVESQDLSGNDIVIVFTSEAGSDDR